MNAREIEIFEQLLDATIILKSRNKPSDWYEEKMIMPAGSAFPGPIRYDRTPYWREPVDCSAEDHPARDITIMAPAQMGKSIMVLNPIVGHTIDEDPCNILFLTGHTDLTKKAVKKIDFMIQNCDLRDRIRPSVMKAKNNRTGDTMLDKEFIGGQFIAGSITNHNLMRQNDIKKSIADDLDAGEMAKDQTGSTVDLIIGRTKAFEDKCKRYWVSSPQVKGRSLIEMQWNKSDKRLWFVECPKCGNTTRRITLEFKVHVDDKETAGLTWKLDNLGRVEPKSVGYVCQKCAAFFTDQLKYELLNSGVWMPTAEPTEHYHFGYHVNGLYGAPGMTSWFTLAQRWLMCNPPGQARNESDYQVWKNVFMGELYEPPGNSLKSSQLMANIRDYQIGTIPEKMSMKDGNGRIVLLTLTADLGGLVAGINSTYDDVRLDWEVKAWSETGSTYSIQQGSIGEFKPAHMGKKDENQLRWSADISKPTNIWKAFNEIVNKTYQVDTGRVMKIGITGIDTGFAEHQVFSYIDRSPFMIIGLKGDKDHKYTTYGDNSSNWRASPNRNKLYLLKVSKLKDELAAMINLRWDRHSEDPQPPGFMNFPQPAGGQYDPTNYFLHFEAEERKVDKNGNFIWEKKTRTHQNHFFDVNNYHLAVKELLMDNIMKDMKIINATWSDFSAWLKARMNVK